MLFFVFLFFFTETTPHHFCNAPPETNPPKRNCVGQMPEWVSMGILPLLCTTREHDKPVHRGSKPRELCTVRRGQLRYEIHPARRRQPVCLAPHPNTIAVFTYAQTGLHFSRNIWSKWARCEYAPSFSFLPFKSYYCHTWAKANDGRINRGIFRFTFVTRTELNHHKVFKLSKNVCGSLSAILVTPTTWIISQIYFKLQL